MSIESNHELMKDSFLESKDVINNIFDKMNAPQDWHVKHMTFDELLVALYRIQGVFDGTTLDEVSVTSDDMLEDVTAYNHKLQTIVGNIKSIEGNFHYPGTEDKVIVNAKTYSAGDQVVAGDSNLTPENIKKGVKIFNVEGELEVYDNNDEPFGDKATATEEDIIKPLFAYDNDKTKIVGNLNDYRDSSRNGNINKTDDTYIYIDPIDKAVYDHTSLFRIKQKTLGEKLGVKPDTIKKGTTILGIDGTYEPEKQIIYVPTPTDPTSEPAITYEPTGTEPATFVPIDTDIPDEPGIPTPPITVAPTDDGPVTYIPYEPIDTEVPTDPDVTNIGPITIAPTDEGPTTYVPYEPIDTESPTDPDVTEIGVATIVPTGNEPTTYAPIDTHAPTDPDVTDIGPSTLVPTSGPNTLLPPVTTDPPTISPTNHQPSTLVPTSSDRGPTVVPTGTGHITEYPPTTAPTTSPGNPTIRPIDPTSTAPVTVSPTNSTQPLTISPTVPGPATNTILPTSSGGVTTYAPTGTGPSTLVPTSGPVTVNPVNTDESSTIIPTSGPVTVVSPDGPTITYPNTTQPITNAPTGTGNVSTINPTVPGGPTTYSPENGNNTIVPTGSNPVTVSPTDPTVPASIVPSEGPITALPTNSNGVVTEIPNTNPNITGSTNRPTWPVNPTNPTATNKIRPDSTDENPTNTKDPHNQNPHNPKYDYSDKTNDNINSDVKYITVDADLATNPVHWDYSFSAIYDTYKDTDWNSRQLVNATKYRNPYATGPEIIQNYYYKITMKKEGSIVTVGFSDFKNSYDAAQTINDTYKFDLLDERLGDAFSKGMRIGIYVDNIKSSVFEFCGNITSEEEVSTPFIPSNDNKKDVEKVRKELGLGEYGQHVSIGTGKGKNKYKYFQRLRCPIAAVTLDVAFATVCIKASINQFGYVTIHTRDYECTFSEMDKPRTEATFYKEEEAINYIKQIADVVNQYPHYDVTASSSYLNTLGGGTIYNTHKSGSKTITNICDNGLTTKGKIKHGAAWGSYQANTQDQQAIHSEYVTWTNNGGHVVQTNGPKELNYYVTNRIGFDNDWEIYATIHSITNNPPQGLGRAGLFITNLDGGFFSHDQTNDNKPNDPEDGKHGDNNGNNEEDLPTKPNTIHNPGNNTHEPTGTKQSGGPTTWNPHDPTRPNTIFPGGDGDITIQPTNSSEPATIVNPTDPYADVTHVVDGEPGTAYPNPNLVITYNPTNPNGFTTLQPRNPNLPVTVLPHGGPATFYPPITDGGIEIPATIRPTCPTCSNYEVHRCANTVIAVKVGDNWKYVRSNDPAFGTIPFEWDGNATIKVGDPGFEKLLEALDLNEIGKTVAPYNENGDRTVVPPGGNASVTGGGTIVPSNDGTRPVTHLPTSTKDPVWIIPTKGDPTAVPVNDGTDAVATIAPSTTDLSDITAPITEIPTGSDPGHVTNPATIHDPNDPTAPGTVQPYNTNEDVSEVPTNPSEPVTVHNPTDPTAPVTVSSTDPTEPNTIVNSTDPTAPVTVSPTDPTEPNTIVNTNDPTAPPTTEPTQPTSNTIPPTDSGPSTISPTDTDKPTTYAPTDGGPNTISPSDSDEPNTVVNPTDNTAPITELPNDPTSTDPATLNPVNDATEPVTLSPTDGGNPTIVPTSPETSTNPSTEVPENDATEPVTEIPTDTSEPPTLVPTDPESSTEPATVVPTDTDEPPTLVPTHPDQGTDPNTVVDPNTTEENTDAGDPTLPEFGPETEDNTSEEGPGGPTVPEITDEDTDYPMPNPVLQWCYSDYYLPKQYPRTYVYNPERYASKISGVYVKETEKTELKKAYIVNGKFTYEEAVADAASKGMQLVRIKSKEDQKIVDDLLKENLNSGYYYTGLNLDRNYNSNDIPSDAYMTKYGLHVFNDGSILSQKDYRNFYINLNIPTNNIDKNWNVYVSSNTGKVGKWEYYSETSATSENKKNGYIAERINNKDRTVTTETETINISPTINVYPEQITAMAIPFVRYNMSQEEMSKMYHYGHNCYLDIDKLYENLDTMMPSLVNNLNAKRHIPNISMYNDYMSEWDSPLKSSDLAEIQTIENSEEDETEPKPTTSPATTTPSLTTVIY